MVSRPDMHTLPVEAPLDQVMRVFATNPTIADSGLSGNDRPHLGFVHIKDMMWVLLDREAGCRSAWLQRHSICGLFARTSDCSGNEARFRVVG